MAMLPKLLIALGLIMIIIAISINITLFNSVFAGGLLLILMILTIVSICSAINDILMYYSIKSLIKKGKSK